MTDADTAASLDLIYGAEAIAEALNLRVGQARSLIEKGHLPTFKLGGKICARRSTLTAWLAEREAAGRKPLPEADRGQAPEADRPTAAVTSKCVQRRR